jgi:hypothetical protein
MILLKRKNTQTRQEKYCKTGLIVPDEHGDSSYLLQDLSMKTLQRIFFPFTLVCIHRHSLFQLC